MEKYYFSGHRHKGFFVEFKLQALGFTTLAYLPSMEKGIIRTGFVY